MTEIEWNTKKRNNPMEPYGIVHCTPCKHQQKNSQKSGKNANENDEILF